MRYLMIYKCSGTLLLLVGIAIRYWRARRRFNRRNLVGIELFPSFSKKILTNIVEGIAGIVSILCIIAGTALLLAGLVHQYNS